MTTGRAFAPGDFVSTFRKEAGLVLDAEAYRAALLVLREGRRPGRYFSPGCCANPDYITQIPVLFSDGSFDVMRSMNLRRIEPPGPEDRRVLQDILGRLAIRDAEGRREED